MGQMVNSVLCYIEQNEQYLMLYRNKKQHDINGGKWIGVGGKFEAGEAPEEALIREVREETGLTLTRYQRRGLVTFVYGDLTEYMFLYTADRFEGTLTDCDEGELHWINKTKVPDRPTWAGDRVFLPRLMGDDPYFSIKLVYDGDTLVECTEYI